MAEPTARAHWWTTLPGMLTAVAALLTAVTGLLLGLGQLGLVGGDDPAASERSAPAATASVSGADGGSTAAATSPSSPPVDADVGAASTTLPLEQPFRIGEASYTLLDAHVRPDTDGSVALELTVRMTKHTPYDANFWDDSFRVVVGADTYAASGGLNELVAGESSGQGKVLFLLPDTTRSAELVLRYRDGRRTVPFEIVPPPG